MTEKMMTALLASHADQLLRGEALEAEYLALFPEWSKELEPMLDTMASKGTVFKRVKDADVKYRLLPTLVGFSETPFWPG